MATISRWLNSGVEVHTGSLPELNRHIPFFERQPFAVASPSLATREHSRLDAIVRLPTSDDQEYVAVGVVSKDYALLPHSAVVAGVANALEAAEIDPASVQAELRLTELGERMALSIQLPDSYLFDPGDHYPMTVRLECLNSVDGSTRFRAEMGWYRLVCSNGLAIGVTRSASSRRHVGGLQLADIGTVLRAGIDEYQVERQTLVKWRKIAVGTTELRAWIDTHVRASWGFKAATRAFHIATSGHDVNIVGPYKHNAPTTIDVEPSFAVPGSPATSTNLFEVSQILAWLAKERTDIQEQMEWRGQIPSLMLKIAS